MIEMNDNLRILNFPLKYLLYQKLLDAENLLYHNFDYFL